MAYLYERVAAELEATITRGDLRPGDRVPSVRAVQKSFGVSLATAVQALATLEKQGLVEARPQSGYYVTARLVAAAPAPEVASLACCPVETVPLINEVVAAARNPDLAPLGATTVAPDLLPGAALAKCVAWAQRELGSDWLQYEMPPGNEDLRRQIALRAFAYGVRVAPEDVVVTTGSMEALSLSLRAVTRPGDTVAIESPMFYGIIELLHALDLRVLEIPANAETGLDLAALAAALGGGRRIAACLSIPSFNNPLGGLMPDGARKELVELLAAHEIPLVEDDVYGDLGHDGTRPPAAKAYDRKGLVLHCSSFSKTLSPGLRVGWVMPGRFKERIQRLKFVSTVATATLPQAAVARFLERGGYDKHLRRLRSQLKTRVAQYGQAVERAFPEGTRVSRPAGGFVLWVQMPPTVDACDLYRAARDEGVAIIPGPAFSSELGRYTSSIRLSCGSALTPTMASAVATLGALAHESGRRR